MSRYRAIALLPLMAALSGCNMVVLNPSGDVASQQGNLVVISTLLMLLIIVPVMVLTVLFAWRYRQSNSTARYEPDWDHSTQLELIIWAAPLLIIICLGALTWMGSHLLDPYRPIDRIGDARPVTDAHRPLDVQVVALDWKWLFLYPEYGIASVNQMAAPVDRPIRFSITASSVMNSFYVPALAGQVYAMAGMETKLHAVINEPGTYKGFSANYSGAGFSHMRFDFLGLSDGDFDRWVAQVKADSGTLDRDAYRRLEKPSEKDPVRHYGQADPALFRAIVNRCVEPGTPCMSDMAHQANVLRPAPDLAGATGLCTVAEAVDDATTVSASTEGAASSGPVASIVGAGLPRPSFTPIRALSTDRSGEPRRLANP